MLHAACAGVLPDVLWAVQGSSSPACGAGRAPAPGLPAAPLAATQHAASDLQGAAEISACALFLGPLATVVLQSTALACAVQVMLNNGKLMPALGFGTAGLGALTKCVAWHACLLHPLLPASPSALWLPAPAAWR